MKGTGGIGGRRYQVAAVILTYAAVSMSAVPIGISQIVKAKKEQKQTAANHVTSAVAPSDASSQAESVNADDDSDQAPAATRPKVSLGAALGMLALAGLASPFLELSDPVHGAIGLVILVVGIRIAWRLTAEKAVDIVGPFNNSTPAPSTATSG